MTDRVAARRKLVEVARRHGLRWVAESLLADLEAVERERDRLRAENNRLHEEIRVREESQIPVIPRGAQERYDRLRAAGDNLAADMRAILNSDESDASEALAEWQQAR